jgi:hypothetical protein
MVWRFGPRTRNARLPDAPGPSMGGAIRLQKIWVRLPQS